MTDIHHTASDDEGDQVTYGNPEHYIGGLFDLRSQEQEWTSDLASSYKPLAAYRKLQEVSLLHSIHYSHLFLTYISFWIFGRKHE